MRFHEIVSGQTLKPDRKRLAAGWPEWRKVQNRLRAFMSGDEWSAMFRTLQAVMKATRAAPHTLATDRT